MVTILTTPADAFLPKSVPCGPRRTSIRSTSNKSSVACPGRLYTTPSITVETEGSTPGEVVTVPIPRTNKEVSLLEAPARKLTLGTCVTNVSSEFRCCLSSSFPLMTETATGTFWSDSSRRVAVTTTVSN